MTSENVGESSLDWQEIWQQHSSWLRTVLVARLRDHLVADELLQEVAVIAWRKLEQLEDQEKVAPWLYRIALRQVQQFWRKQSGQEKQRRPLDQHDTNQVDARQVDPLTWMTHCEAHETVRNELQNLSDQDREILMLKHTEGWTYQQVANHLGISMDKVVYRLNRARQQLRNRLAALENEWVSK